MSSYIDEIIVPFIKKHGERRIPQETLDYYRAFKVLTNTQDEVVISEVRENEESEGLVGLLALSFCVIRNATEILFSATVTSKQKRKKGHGEAALLSKLKNIEKKSELPFSTEISSNSTAGFALCQKVGMKKTEEKLKYRKDNRKYVAFVVTLPPKVKESVSL